MAEAARSCKHYVSDCLAERHPYDVKKGFGGQRARDKGLVFNGYHPQGIDKLMTDLSTDGVSDEEKCKAVHHLFAYSASQEEKIEMVKKDIVHVIVSLLDTGACSPMLENQCFLLLRSLAIVPQGCYPVVKSGGVAACLRSITNPSEKDQARLQPITAALSVLQQVAFDYAGVRWMLDAEDCEEFCLADARCTVAEPTPTPSAITAALVGILQEAVGSPAACARSASLHAVRTLEQTTLLTPGVRAMYDEGNLECIEGLLETFTEEKAVQAAQVQFLTALLTTVWNIGMDQEGVEAMEQLGIPESLLAIFLLVQESYDSTSLKLQRSLLGAFSAVSKLTSVKHRGHEPVINSLTQVEVMINYIRNINKFIESARGDGVEPSADVIAISKNSVQCVRLASEVKSVRDITHKYINGLEKLSSKEAFYLRRQLYFSTIWEKEYDASV